MDGAPPPRLEASRRAGRGRGAICASGSPGDEEARSSRETLTQDRNPRQGHQGRQGWQGRQRHQELSLSSLLSLQSLMVSPAFCYHPHLRPMNDTPLTIIGAGPAGLTAAILG